MGGTQRNPLRLEKGPGKPQELVKLEDRVLARGPWLARPGSSCALDETSGMDGVAALDKQQIRSYSRNMNATLSTSSPDLVKALRAAGYTLTLAHRGPVRFTYRTDAPVPVMVKLATELAAGYYETQPFPG